MPEVEIPSACVSVSHAQIPAEELDARLRKGNPPVVGRIAKGRILLDMRSVRDGEVAELAGVLVAAARTALAPREMIDPGRRRG